MSTTLDGLAVQHIAELAQKAIPKATNLKETQVPTLLWQDKTLQDIEHLMARPVTKRGRALLGDAVAFSDYVNAHRTLGLLICGEVTEAGGNFTAILDGHIPAKLEPAGENTPDAEVVIVDDGLPGWGEHIATLELKATPEWARWLGNHGKSLTQDAFACFLEENAADVIVPAQDITHVAGFPIPHGQLPNSAELMSVALTLQAKTDVQFSSKINRHNGQTQLTYHETVAATHAGAAEGKIGIPEFFCIAVAPFRGGATQIVLCRLRFRAGAGKASFEYQIIRPHKIVEHAWKLVAADIHAATREAVLLGKVEIPTRQPRR